MQIKQLTVTPAQAEKWLENNMPTNRKLKERMVNKIAADIQAGRWIETGQTIQFNAMGFLIDGQHRLKAIAKAGIAVTLWIATDVASEAINVIDTGTSRSLSDVLGLNGFTNSTNNMAALARKITAYQAGVIGVMGEATKQRRTKTTQELLAFCQENDLLPYIRFASRLDYESVTKGLFTHGEWAFIYWLLSEMDEPDAQKFLLDLANLRGDDNSVIRQLFHRLTRSSISLDPTTKLKVIIRCWNAWRRGDQPELKLRFVQEQAVPELV